MSSKYSVLNFSKSQEILQRAADALRSYVYIGVIWAAGAMAVLYSKYGYCGALVGLIANLLIMGWIIASYLHSFKRAAADNGLKMPCFWGC